MIKTLCIRYALIMLGLAVLTTVLAFALDRFFGIEWPSGANIALIFITAMVTGMTCYEKLGEMPDKKIMWKLGCYFTLIQFFLAICIMTLLIQVDPAVSNTMGQLSLVTWLSITFFAFLIILLLNRFGFSFGINQAKKLADVKKVKE